MLYKTQNPGYGFYYFNLFNIALAFVFIKVLGLPTWGLAAAFSIGSFIQAVVLFILINKRLESGSMLSLLTPVFKSILHQLSLGYNVFDFEIL